MAMKVQFNDKISGLSGGERYAVGKTYYLSREEACLWTKLDALVLGSVEPADLTPEAEAEHRANLQPGRDMSLAEILAAASQASPA